MRLISKTDPLIELCDKVMNLAMKAYITSGNQKTVIAVRQTQDIFLDKFKEMTDPKTILRLDNEAMRAFLNKKIKKGLEK